MTPIDLRRDDRVLRVTLDRPDALNAIDEEVLGGLAEAVRIARSDVALRAVVISGRGDAFCVGLDIDLLERAFADIAYFRDVLERFNRTLLDLEALDVPVVAAVNGTTRAGGFELVLACDLVLIAEEARIGDVHTRFGVMPGGGATQRAPRKLGPQRAAELIMTSRWLTGTEAVGYGVALRSVPRDQLAGAVEELLGTLVDKSRSCIAAVKRTMRVGAGLPLAEALQLELDAFLDHVEHDPDAREGFNAYREGRSPSWA